MAKIVFLIRDLRYGGAQRQLVTLAKGLKHTDLDVTVLYFYAGGELAQDLIDSGLEVICLNKSKRWEVLGFFARLVRMIRELKPDVLHGYLGESNISLALLKPLFFPQTPLIWGIRESAMAAERSDWLGHLLGVVELPLYSLVDLIIVNSQAGKKDLIPLGLPEAKIRVVSNGIDINRFNRDSSLGAKVRSEWGITPDTILIGLIARLDVMKDHPLFLRAAALLSQERGDVHFVCVGKGVKNIYGEELQQLATELNIADKIIWAGARGDVVAIYNGLDILCSSSAYGEGFSNVIGEAMACGVPCVVTDVGDAGFIVGDLGIVVPPRDEESLKEGLKKAIAHLPHTNHELIRSRIVDNFSVEELVKNTEKIIKGVMTNRV